MITNRKTQVVQLFYSIGYHLIAIESVIKDVSFTNLQLFEENDSYFTHMFNLLKIPSKNRKQKHLLQMQEHLGKLEFFTKLSQSSGPERVLDYYKCLKPFKLTNHATVFNYGDSGSLFYIILKGSVAVKVPIITNYQMTQKQFAEYYIQNYQKIVLAKTTHFINTAEQKDLTFLEFIKKRLEKGYLIGNLLRIHILYR